MTLSSHPKTNHSIKTLLLHEVVKELATGRIRLSNSDGTDPDHRIAAFELAMELQEGFGTSAVGRHIPPDRFPRDDECVTEQRDSAVCIRPLRCVDKEVVTVRRHSNTTVITFTAKLARGCQLFDYEYAVITNRDNESRLDFDFTNDPAAGEGTFRLAYNGGSSREIDSPSRIVQIRPCAVPWLRAGHYNPEVSWPNGQLRIRILVRER